MAIFQNIRDVKLLPGEPGCYLVTLDLDLEDGAGFIESIGAMRPGGGGICDDVLDKIALGNYTGSITDYEPPEETEPVENYSKARLFDNMTDEEFTVWEQREPLVLGTLSVRQQRVWSDAKEFGSDHPLFALILDDMVSNYGQTRTDELLSLARI